MNKKGFTLIELLAVIIILGILMIIAIPSVTNYISDSRKSAYVNTAKQVVGATKNMVNEGKLDMYDTSTTYYIPSSCIKIENGNKAKSPYGEFVDDKTYVVVTYDGKGYDYYWISLDETGIGVKNLVEINNLNEDNIESDILPSDISPTISADVGKTNIKILRSNDCKSFTTGISISNNLYDQVTDISTNNSNNDTIIDNFNNVRYTGKNPNNYIKFNNQEWRIIGIIDGHIKIVLSSTLGGMHWTDAGSNGYTYNTNDWTISNIKTYLNGEYYNSLSESSKSMIEKFTWKLGGIGNSSNWMANKMYTYERGNTVYSDRPTEWTGYIGLMYPSDYALATSGGNTTSREICYETSILDWQYSNVSDCKDNNWMFDNQNIWLITPYNLNSMQVFLIGMYGQVGVNGPNYPTGHQVRPAIYLKNNVNIISGDGSKSNPYVVN